VLDERDDARARVRLHKESKYLNGVAMGMDYIWGATRWTRAT
jgi:hypothetical protein